MLKKLAGQANEFCLKHPSTTGRTFALLSAIAIAGIPISMKLVTPGINFITLIPVQSVLQTIISFLIFMPFDESMYHPDKNITFALFLRGLIGAMNGYLYNLASRYLPSQKFTVIINTFPVWTVILSPFFLNEYPTRRIVAMLFVTLFGVIIMVYPSLILPASWMGKRTEEASKADYPWYFILIPIWGAFFIAGLNIFLKKYSKNISPCQNTCWYTIFTCFLSGFAASASDIPQTGTHMSLKDYAALTSVGVCQCFYLALLGLAIRYERRASVISMLLSTQIVFVYIGDLLIIGNSIKLLNVIGGLMILAASAVIAISKEEQAAALQRTEPITEKN